jgi:hypothetical protein
MLKVFRVQGIDPLLPFRGQMDEDDDITPPRDDVNKQQTSKLMMATSAVPHFNGNR